MSALAYLGGKKISKYDPGTIFDWPIVNKAMEQSIVNVLRERKMSNWDITLEFEKEFARWHGVRYALGHNTGTASLHSAMFGVGLGCGDELICPSITYWASCLQALSLRATVKFVDIDPDTLCIDPSLLEKQISPRTKAVMVVHYAGMPADMDRIMEICRRKKVAVIEDCSHAHGALYKGKIVGSFGDAAGFSIMTGKSFSCGEGGMLITNEREIYERAVAFGFYERHGSDLTIDYLKSGMGLPWGGYKYRMNQFTSALGLVQMKKYPGEMKEVDDAMNYFCDLLEGIPGLKPHRPKKGSGTTKGGWYCSLIHYIPEQLGGLSVTTFCEAVRAEGGACSPGCNRPLHMHPLFHNIDVYREGKPTRIAHIAEDIREKPEDCPVAAKIGTRVFSVGRFNSFKKNIIKDQANTFRKVAENYKDLLAHDKGNPPELGGWNLSFR
jgi:dTDP-4-amino-4,6-dideoxygalactose transaminase